MKFPSYPIQYRHHHIETQSSYHLAKKCISQNHPIRSHQNKIASLVLRQVFSSNLQAQLRHQNRRRGLFPSVLRRGGSTVKPCHWWKSERTLMGIFHPPKTQHKCYRTNGVEKLRNFGRFAVVVCFKVCHRYTLHTFKTSWSPTGLRVKSPDDSSAWRHVRYTV